MAGLLPVHTQQPINRVEKNSNLINSASLHTPSRHPATVDVNCGCESLLVIRLGKILNSTRVPALFSRHRSVTPGWLLHFPLKLPIWLDNRYVGRVLFCNPTRIFNKFFQRGYQRNLKEPNIQDKSPHHIPHAWIESTSFNKVKFKFCQENWQMGRRQYMSEALNIRVLSCLGRSNAGYWHQNKW